MNALLLTAGAAAAAVAGIHLIAGHVDPVRPLLTSTLAEVPKRTMHAVWHLVSVDLVLAAAVLVYLALAQPTGTGLAGMVLAAHFAAYTVVFLVVALSVDGPNRLLRLPQWLLLLPVAILTCIGSL